MNESIQIIVTSDPPGDSFEITIGIEGSSMSFKQIRLGTCQVYLIMIKILRVCSLLLLRTYFYVIIMDGEGFALCHHFLDL